MRRKLTLALSSLALLVGVVAVVLFWRFDTWQDATVASNGGVFLIKPGTSFGRIARQLEEAGYIDDALYFRMAGRYGERARKIKAGEYLIPANPSPNGIFELFVTGTVRTYTVRFSEGFTTLQVLQELLATDFLTPDVELTPSAVRSVLPLETPFVEGVFLPETYQVVRGDPVSDVLLRAHAKMLAALEMDWGDGVAHLESPWELAILASIIEKETGVAEERAQISQVFHSRLGLGMKLQTDPTVIYALGANFDGNIRRADLRVDSPYNTYRYKGLPPTPIALPSRASITAAANPAEGTFLYFVAKGDGTSYFSETLAEHNAAVRRYQLKQK